MARLKMPPQRLAKLQPRLAAPQDERGRSRYRDSNGPWRAWYKTARWQRLRWSVLVAAMFRCAMCGKVEGDTSQLVGDHKRPHRGSEALFWDRDNLQCLCKPCHDSTKQREERASRA